MVMPGSHFPILPLEPKETKEETMEKDEESCHVPENMIATLGMDQFESKLCVHDCGVEKSSLSLTKGIQE
jgi:hypothetical protein